MEKPLVTAFTLIYNNAELCLNSLDCIRTNSYPNIEHIIIDDGSTDNKSINLIENYISIYNYDCKFIKNESNFGICKSLNKVLDIANGKYIFGLSDDLITNKKILDDVEIFEQLPDNYAVVHSMLQYINFDGSIKYPYIIPHFKYPQMIFSDYTLNQIIAMGGLISTPTAFMKTDALRKVGGWYSDIAYEDVQMWFKLTKAGLKFYFRPELTTFYRRSSTQITNTNATFRKGYLINKIKIFGPYLDQPAAKKSILIDFLFSIIRNKTDDLNEALILYKKFPNSSKLIFLIFKYRFWTIPYRFIFNVKTFFQNI